LFDVLAKISDDLNIPRPLLENALALAATRFRKITFKRRSGPPRVAYQPAVELKPILEWLDITLISKLPVSRIATAFCAGSSIVQNAQVHRDSLFSIRVDISNFFPSITSSDLVTAIEATSHLPEWSNAPTTLRVLKQACFDINDRLPIGYSTSPRIANAVMFSLDNLLIQAISDERRFGNSLLTRYADDYLFSTNQRGACAEFLKEIRKILNSVQFPKLQINNEKTRFMSRAGGSTLITGLRIKQTGEIGVHAHYRDHVRLLIKLYAANRLRAEEFDSLRGHLAFVEYADPKLFTHLSFHFSDEITRIRSTDSL
jgi:RNA-directed DNA polymerase